MTSLISGYNKRQKLTIFLIFLIGIILTVLIYPKQIKFRYEYQKGNIWQHDNLYAPFDFVVLKTGTELKTERDSALNQSKLYFNSLAHVWHGQLNRFNLEFDRRYAGAVDVVKLQYPGRNIADTTRPMLKKYALNKLKFIYQKGVTGYNEAFEKYSIDHSVVIVENGIAEVRSVGEIFTLRSAQQYIKNQISTDFSGNPRLLLLAENLKLNEFIEPNLQFNNNTTTKARLAAVDQVSTSRGMVQAGELIISNGDVVSEPKFRILESLRREYQDTESNASTLPWIILGQLMVVSVSFIVLLMFLVSFRREILINPQKVSFIVFVVVFMVTVMSIVTRFNIGNVYMVPFVALPIIIQAFYDGRLAFFIHMVTITLCGLMAPNGFEFVLLQFIGGAISMFSLSKIDKRGQLFAAVLVIIVSYIVTYTALALLQEGDFRQINYFTYLWFALNGLFLLVCYPLIFVIEKAFGFLSDVTLLELSDTNHPLLRQLAEKAPGTFQHVMQVANLAEDAIRKINGNALLMRVGALYHDIGKTNAPQFFIENQSGRNPHDALSYEQSAGIIIDHVHYGVALAKKYKLPQPIIDFITTHHGTGLVRYFYTKYMNDNNNRLPDLSRFTYPGPSPFTKETSVLMMADAVEASSRALKEYTPKTIDELVERIIEAKMNDGQFNDADITFREISIIKEAFKQKLVNIYHSRIEYPELKK